MSLPLPLLQVYQILHMNYYEEFLQSPGYVRLLSDLGLLNPNQNQQQDSDSISLDDGEIGFCCCSINEVTGMTNKLGTF